MKKLAEAIVQLTAAKFKRVRTVNQKTEQHDKCAYVGESKADTRELSLRKEARKALTYVSTDHESNTCL